MTFTLLTALLVFAFFTIFTSAFEEIVSKGFHPLKETAWDYNFDQGSSECPKQCTKEAKVEPILFASEHCLQSYRLFE